jgi:hypothetical protein
VGGIVVLSLLDAMLGRRKAKKKKKCKSNSQSDRINEEVIL